MGDARNDNDEDDDDGTGAGLVFIYGDDDDKDDDDGCADLVFMAVCRPTHGSTIFSFTHFKATEGTETEGGGGIGDSAAKMSSHTCWFAPRYFGAAVIF